MKGDSLGDVTGEDEDRNIGARVKLVDDCLSLGRGNCAVDDNNGDTLLLDRCLDDLSGFLVVQGDDDL